MSIDALKLLGFQPSKHVEPHTVTLYCYCRECYLKFKAEVK